MSFALNHDFVSQIPDWDDTQIVRPSDWNDPLIIHGIDEKQNSLIAAQYVGLDSESRHQYTLIPAEINNYLSPALAALSDLTSLVGYVRQTDTKGGYSFSISTSIPISDVADLSTSLAGKQPLDADLTAVAALTGTGFLARTGDGAYSLRTITGDSNFSIANGDGVSGNPALALVSSPSFTGLTLSGLSTGVVHSDSKGVLTSSLVTNSDLAGSIAASKLVGTDIATVGTITTGTWAATTISAGRGGTGNTSYNLGDLLYGNSSFGLTKLTGNVSTSKRWLSQTGDGSASAAPAWSAITASDIGSGAALTAVNDTNVTVTLGGSPAAALLAAASVTLGWTGQLAVSRGGTGSSAFTSGSIPFSNGSILTQDNSNLFFNDTDNRLAVGHNSPDATLHIKGTNSSAGGFWLESSSAGTNADRLAIYASGNSSTIIQKLNASASLLFYNSVGAQEFVISSSGVATFGSASGNSNNKVNIAGGLCVGSGDYTSVDAPADGINAQGNLRSGALTASRLVSADASKNLVSVSSLTSWIAGTANQITVTDDKDGSVTLSTPQDINTDSTPTFKSLALESPSDSFYPYFNLYRARASYAPVQSGDILGSIQFQGIAANLDGIRTFAEIRATVDGTPGSGDAPGRLDFYTTADGAGTSSIRATLKNSGFLGLGTTAPDTLLHVHQASAGSVTANSSCGITIENNTFTGLQFLFPAGTGAGLYFGSPTTNLRGLLQWEDGSKALLLRSWTNGSDVRPLIISTDAPGSSLEMASNGDIGLGVSPSHPLHLTGDKYMVCGPNSAYSESLQIGGAGNSGTRAQVRTTNGDLLIDPKGGGTNSTYLNLLYGTGGVFFGDGNGSVVARASSASLTSSVQIQTDTAGKTFGIKEGANAGKGTGATLVAGAVTVNTTAVSTGDQVVLTRTASGGTLGFPVVTIVNATSFTITSSSATDTSTFSWVIIKKV